MRIYTDNGAQLLQEEIQRLEAQCQNCLGVENNISGFSLAGMQGEARQALEQKINLQAAVVKAHMAFYQSLLLADRDNLALVRALPTTSSGVLDTDVAQERIENARRERTRLDGLKRQTTSQNVGNAQNGSWNYNSAPPITVSTPLTSFTHLISAQDVIIHQNEQIIEKANRYVREAAALYSGVDLSLIDASGKSVVSFFTGKGYGNANWIKKATEQVSFNAEELEKRDDWLYNLLGGKLSDEYSEDSEEVSVTGAILGIPIAYQRSHDRNGWNYDIKSYEKETGVGVKGEEEAYLEKESQTFSIGNKQFGKATISTNTECGKIETASEFGAKLLNSKGELDPSIKANFGGSATLITADANVGLEYGELADTRGAKIDLLTASADAKLELSKEGLNTKVGAEAYVVSGELSRSINLFGIKIDAALEAKALGAGVEAGAGVDADGIALDLGLGLGLGLEGKVRVDWSDAVADYRESVSRLDEWWVDRR